MPKAYLKFDLPEESAEFRVASDGQRYLAALQDLDEEFRRIQKHSELEYMRDYAAWARERLHDAMDANGVNLDVSE